MMPRSLGRLWMLAALATGIASAQTFPFNLLATEGANTVIVPNNSTIAVTAAVGAQAVVDVKATYAGTGQATITMAPQQTGSTQFSATLDPTDGAVPFMLSFGQSFIFHVKYIPTNAERRQRPVHHSVYYARHHGRDHRNGGGLYHPVVHRQLSYVYAELHPAIHR